MAELSLIISVDDKGTPVLRQIAGEGAKTGKGLEGASKRSTKRIAGFWKKLGGDFKGTMSIMGSAANVVTAGVLVLDKVVSKAVAGAAKLGKSFLSAAVESENIKIQLKFLTNTSEEAAAAFETLVDFAGKVPFTFQEIQATAPVLLTVAKNADELNRLLEITGDIAAATGLGFGITASQIQRAISSSLSAAELFREKGIKELLGFQGGVEVTGKEFKAAIIDMWEKGTVTLVGASKAMADTWAGMVSMLQDAWFKFRVKIGRAHV